MEDIEIFKFTGLGSTHVSRATEIEIIEYFAKSNLVPDERWLDGDFTKLGFTLFPEIMTDNGNAHFIDGDLPDGWRRQLNTDKDYIVELLDHKARLRGYFKFKPWDYARTTFVHRYERRLNMIGSTVAMTVWDNLDNHQVWTSGLVNEHLWSRAGEVAQQGLIQFMDENYHGWQSPASYWP